MKRISRRHLLGLVAPLIYTSIRNEVVAEGRMMICPESFGAVGDLESNDGEAIARMFQYVNEIPENIPISLQFSGAYSLRGCPEIDYPPRGNSNRGGRVYGLPPLLRGNMEIEASGAYFQVPDSYKWTRTEKKGGAEDRFCCGLQIYGNDWTLNGGHFDGNLGNRLVTRGAAISGYGGSEYGLVAGGHRWSITNTKINDWGTDCVLIVGSGSIEGSKFEYGRRNNISIVPFGYQDVWVEISSCEFSNGGNWPDDIRNRPGAAIQVERSRYKATCGLKLLNSNFHSNKEKDLQLSKGSVNCVITDNVFRNNVNFRPGNLGGHTLQRNIFKQKAKLGFAGLNSMLEQSIFRENCVESKALERILKNPKLAKHDMLLIVENIFNSDCG